MGVVSFLSPKVKEIIVCMICDWILFLSLPQEKKEGMSGKRRWKSLIYITFSISSIPKLVKKN
jgi:hypothetical protein